MHFIKPCRRDKKVHCSKWFNHSSTAPAQSVFLPACIRVLNMPDPTGIVCFFPRNTQNTIPLKDKRLFLHPRRIPSPHRFLTQEAERKSRSPGRCAQAALDAEEGGRKGREGGGEKNWKGLIFFSSFPPLVTKAVHIWVGPAGAISLKADFGEVSLWSIQPGGVTLSGPARRRHAGAVSGTMRKLVPLRSTIGSQHVCSLMHVSRSIWDASVEEV